jgi:hypothetical protein
MPIQDVKTCWDSTFLMLQRAKRLQSTYNAFCSESQYALPHLTLDHEEWRHIEYLLCITQPLFRFTTLLSQTRDVSIHLVFSIYNKLFDHLEKSMDALRRKRVLWKQLVLKALEAAKSKLSHCYAMTDDIPCDLYAIGTIIAPQNKLKIFQPRNGKIRIKIGSHAIARALKIIWSPTKKIYQTSSHNQRQTNALLCSQNLK